MSLWRSRSNFQGISVTDVTEAEQQAMQHRQLSGARTGKWHSQLAADQCKPVARRIAINRTGTRVLQVQAVGREEKCTAFTRPGDRHLQFQAIGQVEMCAPIARQVDLHRALFGAGCINNFRCIVLMLCATCLLMLTGCVTESYTNPSVPGAGPMRVDVSAGGHTGSARNTSVGKKPPSAPSTPNPASASPTGKSGGAAKLPDGAEPAISNTDPCATRLHDISGLILMYQMQHWQLPGKLTDLADLPGYDQLEGMTCPQSHKPYIYSPSGIILPEQGRRVIVYDPEPSHSGMRLAITMDEPRDDQPAVTRVVVLPESFFTFLSPSR